MRFMNIDKIKNSKGFTLIEVIASLIVAGILGVMLVSFLGTAMTKSSNPIIVAQNGNYLSSIMEKMYADYKYQMVYARLHGQTPQTGFAAFENHVNTVNYYANDASHPYTVVTKKRISFSGNPPAEIDDAGSKILKITIKYQDLSATQLFTE
ncbi:MAG: prepilin-type N-terminal cleavage/methylation domain-containing protein [Smithella sp.]